MKLKNIKITCPKCGYEYFPCEIFYPTTFFGKPEEILRTNGKIVYSETSDMNLEEEYTCDGCGTTFVVEADVKFKVDVDESRNFGNDYSTPLNDKIELNENVEMKDLW